jgi:hypothetical protein
MLSDAGKDIEIANNHSFNILLPYLSDKINLKNLPIPKSITEKTGLNITERSNFSTLKRQQKNPPFLEGFCF